MAAALCVFAASARAEGPPTPTAPVAAPELEAKPVAAPDSVRDPAVSVAGRVAAEALMGAGVATVGFLAGPELAGAACRTCLFAAGFAGATAVFPLGVYWGGYLVRGEGSFWLTVAAPWLVSATAFTALALDQDYDGKPAFPIAAIGGAVAAPLSIVLYELTHAVEREEPPRAAGPRLHVAISPRDDGLALILARAF